jgi:hypothetical protein
MVRNNIKIFRSQMEYWVNEDVVNKHMMEPALKPLIVNQRHKSLEIQTCNKTRNAWDSTAEWRRAAGQNENGGIVDTEIGNRPER